LADKSHTAFLPTNFSYKPISNKNNKNNPNSLNKTAKLNQISVGNQTTSQTLHYQQNLTIRKKENKTDIPNISNSAKNRSATVQNRKKKENW
jgi:hypothetical protein